MFSIRKQSGFSLMEIVIVASVVMIGFVGILALAERTIRFRSINQKALVAAQLAQEGVELVRYIRNDNWLRGLNFSYRINSDSRQVNNNNEAIFAITIQGRTSDQFNDYPSLRSLYNTNGTPEHKETLGCNNSTNFFDCYLKSEAAKLYQDPNFNDFYTIDKDGSLSETDYSGFNRLIKTVYHDNDTPTDYNDDYLYVVVKVYWQDRGKDYIYSDAVYLFDYDWYY